LYRLGLPEIDPTIVSTAPPEKLFRRDVPRCPACRP
jgi:hypothetical protein